MSDTEPSTPQPKFPLRPLVNGWWDIIRKGNEFKKKEFQDQADEAMKFYECSKELQKIMWERDRDDPGVDEFPAPQFRALVGKTAEVVQLFGPTLYHRNPTNIVEPKSCQPPLEVLAQLLPPEMLQQAQMAAQQSGQPFTLESLFPPDPIEPKNTLVAFLLQYVINYVQRESDKKTHSRRMIDEALIKGRGVLWTEEYQPYPGGPVMVGSFHASVDDLVIDPDAETIESAWWIARKHTKPIWWVAEKYSLDIEKVKSWYGTKESFSSQADTSEEAEHKRKIGKSNDLIEYYEVYSKMGMGHRLKDMKDMPDEMIDMLDSFGDNCLIVVAEKVPHPLNVKPKLLRRAARDTDKTKADKASDKAFIAAQWPIPFWADGSWPCTPLDFHEVPGSPWPMSHMKPALGYLKFMNWTMSFLMNRIRHSCRTIMSGMKGADDTIEAKATSGKDFEYIPIPKELAQDGDIAKIVHYLKAPEVNPEIWKILDAVSMMFDKATGLTEIAYGVQGGMRSSAEAQIKESNRSIRPDDMASKTEDALSLVARKESMALQWLDPKYIQQLLGERCYGLWQRFVASKDDSMLNIDAVCREFNYRVEAGSTRKPNKETRVQQMNEAMQVILPIILPFAQATGNIQPVNAFLKKWCEAMDIESKDFLLPPPPPPPPNPMQQKIEAEIQLEREKHELEKQKMSMELQAQQQKSAMDVQAIQAKTQAQVEAARLKMQIEQMKAQQEMQLGQQEMLGDMQMQKMELGMKSQEMQMGHQMKQQEMAMQGQQHQAQMAMQGQQHSQKMQMGEQAAQQKMQIGEKQAQSKMQLGEQQARAKMAMQQQAAAAKPAAKPRARGKGKKK